MIRRSTLLTCLSILLANVYKIFSQECPDDPISFPNRIKYQKGDLSLEHKWNGGVKMQLTFSIPENINGWRLLIRFSEPIKLEIWRARHIKESTSNNLKKVFRLKNMSWNKKLYEGNDLKMAFLARFPPSTKASTAKLSTKVCFAYLLWRSKKQPPTTKQPQSTEPTSNPITTATSQQPTTAATQQPTTATTQQPTTATTQQTTAATTQQPTTATTQQPTTATTQQTTAATTQQPTTATTQQPSTATTQQPTTATTQQTTAATTQQSTTVTTQQPSPTIITQAPSVTPSCSKYDYNEVLHKSILFYEAQRSGKLPNNNRIPWRGDSALTDKGDAGEDLTGGWYDAGDFVKFGFPMAFSTTLLTWGFIEYKDAYFAAGEHDQFLDSIKWPLDYFIKAHVDKYELYGQVGDGYADHAQWGRPEDMTINRPAFKIDMNRPGSDLAGETAAAMAAGSIAFQRTNRQYSDTLLRHAKELYDFASKYRGKYTNSIPQANDFYASSHYDDELAWAAAWLYRATNDLTYLEKAEQHFKDWDQLSKPAWGFSWDEKIAGVQMLMYKLTDKDNYREWIQSSLREWLSGGSVQYTPKGLAWRIKWGANRYSANTAFLALLAADKGLNSEVYTTFARNQIHYMLGDTGRSYVVGFGDNPPQRPHHRSSSCPDQPASCTWADYNNPRPNPQILYGALVGGSDQFDNYVDRRNDFIMNEVACDYNAGFQSAIAALKARENCLKK